MDKIINIKSRRDKKLSAECERLQEECKLLEVLTGYIQRKDGRNFVLQGAQPSFETRQDDWTTNLNYFSYFVDNQLIIEGWNPCDVIPFDEKYFAKRKKTLSHIGWSKIKEERSEYRDSGKPCVVIYGKN